MIKGLSIQNAGLKDKVHALCVLKFNISATEELILYWLIQQSINNSLSLNVDISRQLQIYLNISSSALATSLYRLGKKGIIAKSGKTITLNPIFNNIQELDKLVISFLP